MVNCKIVFAECGLPKIQTKVLDYLREIQKPVPEADHQASSIIIPAPNQQVSRDVHKIHKVHIEEMQRGNNYINLAIII